MSHMRRKDREQGEEFARAVLKKCEYGVLATVNDDATPYCIPVSPVLCGNVIYFHCALKGQKIDNLTSRPQVCLTCVGDTRLLPQAFTTAYESAVVCGQAEMVEDEAEKRLALSKLCEKYAAENMEQVPAAIERSLARTGICKITIASLTGKAKIVP